MDTNLSLGRGLQDSSSYQPYIPEDFANFENYNATLESQERCVPSHSDMKGSRCGGVSGEKELPRSPTASSCTSGYFSQSASNATLSDMPFSASESSDHISCASRDHHEPVGCSSGRGCAQTKSASAGSDCQQSPRSAVGAQEHPSSLPANITNCTDKQQTFIPPHNCALSASPEFTDFKGAEDNIGEAELAPFTEGWEQEHVEFSVNQQEKTDNIETHVSQPYSDVSAIINICVPANKCKFPNNADFGGVASTTETAVCTSVRAHVSDEAPPPVSPSTVTHVSSVSSSAPAPRAGGEPPIQEPAQGDLPHGSPCPSPNPSSAEPSGDSSGDESTPAAQLPDWMAPGEQVWVGKRRGTVHYVGGVEFAKGIWIGVKLDMAVGKHL